MHMVIISLIFFINIVYFYVNYIFYGIENVKHQIACAHWIYLIVERNNNPTDIILQIIRMRLNFDGIN